MGDAGQITAEGTENGADISPPETNSHRENRAVETASEQTALTAQWESLAATNPEAFLQFADAIAERAATLRAALPRLGENHPLAAIARKKRDPHSLQRLAEGMELYRKMIEES
jgi:hypothetical protein